MERTECNQYFPSPHLGSWGAVPGLLWHPSSIVWAGFRESKQHVSSFCSEMPLGWSEERKALISEMESCLHYPSSKVFLASCGPVTRHHSRAKATGVQGRTGKGNNYFLWIHKGNKSPEQKHPKIWHQYDLIGNEMKVPLSRAVGICSTSHWEQRKQSLGFLTVMLFYM